MSTRSTVLQACPRLLTAERASGGGCWWGVECWSSSLAAAHRCIDLIGSNDAGATVAYRSHSGSHSVSRCLRSSLTHFKSFCLAPAVKWTDSTSPSGGRRGVIGKKLYLGIFLAYERVWRAHWCTGHGESTGTPCTALVSFCSVSPASPLVLTALSVSTPSAFLVPLAASPPLLPFRTRTPLRSSARPLPSPPSTLAIPSIFDLPARFFLSPPFDRSTSVSVSTTDGRLTRFSTLLVSSLLVCRIRRLKPRKTH